MSCPSASHCISAGSSTGVRIAWRLVGRDGSGRCRAGRHLCGSHRHEHCHREGLVGRNRRSGRAARHAIAIACSGIDFLGGSGQTTGPQRGQTRFSVDQRFRSGGDTATLLLEHLRHRRSCDMIVGASYGGMVALAFARTIPATGRAHLVVISAADRAHPMSTAWRSVQRAIVRYALKHNDGPEGLRLARALAMATYRSADEFADALRRRAAAGRWSVSVSRRELPARRAAMRMRRRIFRKRSSACPNRSICIGSMRRRFACRRRWLPCAKINSCRWPTCSRCRRVCRRPGLIELSSLYGHDAFLKEAQTLACRVRSAR